MKPERKPPWLRVRVGQGGDFLRVQGIIRDSNLHTVCEEALCPNLGECWQYGHATIMILGDHCTRSCGFCNVRFRKHSEIDPDEPRRAADAVKKTGLREVVITSVTRDDLPDGGAGIWAETITRIHEAVPGVPVEVLIPDFSGAIDALELVLRAAPEILGHNLETVPSLYSKVRPLSDYGRSLAILRRSSGAGLITKTAIMLGLGETEAEVLALMKDARKAGVDILYIGQYLRPLQDNVPVERYVEPAEFDDLRRKALDLGFPVVVSAPLVRSSYRSDEQAKYVAARLGVK